jgi:hypothetical protein
MFCRAEGSLGGARDDLVHVRDRRRQTRQEMDAIRRREDELAAHPPADRGGRRGLSRKAAEDVSPRLGDARRKLVTATEAALVVNGFLDALAELSLGERVGIDVDRLRLAADELSALIGRADRLAAHLAGAPSDPAAGGIADQSSRIAESLDRVITAVDEGAARVTSAQERVEAWHARVTGWLTTTAVVVTLILAWAGTGQLSLLVHARRWVRKS